MARNGNSHEGEKLQITGKVIQVQDMDSGGQCFVSLLEQTDTMIYTWYK